MVDEEIKKELDKIKIYPRETYGDVIKMLLQKNYQLNNTGG